MTFQPSSTSLLVALALAAVLPILAAGVLVATTPAPDFSFALTQRQ